MFNKNLKNYIIFNHENDHFIDDFVCLYIQC